MTFEQWWNRYKKYHPVEMESENYQAIFKAIAESAWNARVINHYNDVSVINPNSYEGRNDF